WTGDEPARRALGSSTERAVELGCGPSSSSPAAAAAGRFDYLMDALVAELELVGEVAQRCTAQVETSYSAVKFGTVDLTVLLGVEQPLLSLPGVCDQLFVDHVVYGT